MSYHGLFRTLTILAGALTTTIESNLVTELVL